MAQWRSSNQFPCWNGLHLVSLYLSKIFKLESPSSMVGNTPTCTLMLSMHFLGLLTLNHMLPSKHNNLPHWPSPNLVLLIDHWKNFNNVLHLLIAFVDPPHTIMKAHKVQARIKLMIITFPIKGIQKKRINLTYFHNISIKNQSTSLTSKSKLNKTPNNFDNSPSLTYFHLPSTTQLGRLIVFLFLVQHQ
jgi:hypothetical protein